MFRLLWLSVAAGVVTIALKTAAWLVTGSVGLLSDAAESVVNVVAAGHITRLNARADEPLPSGTAVVVTSVLSPTSVRVSRREG